MLKHVDFKIESGEFVYLIGRVGSGKSSLLKNRMADTMAATQMMPAYQYFLTE